MKKWLSRGIVLAMVLALMIPAPVLAKGEGSGGKLVKAVTGYDYNSDAGRFEAEYKQSFTYDKKNNPKEIREDFYSGSFFGIPTGADTEISTVSYKYKGSTPKSMKVKNAAGVITETRTYKKGKVTRLNSTRNWSEFVDGAEKAGCSTRDEYFTYGKQAFVSEMQGTSLRVDPDGTSTSSTSARTSLAISLKKKLPSFVLEQVTSTSGDINKWYYTCNAKGLVAEAGWIDTETGVPTATAVFNYTVKKGVVKSVVIYVQDDNNNWVPTYMYKFDYQKTKVSKNRYCKMINSFVAGDSYWLWY